jgi:hypothetical protein
MIKQFFHQYIKKFKKRKELTSDISAIIIPKIFAGLRKVFAAERCLLYCQKRVCKISLEMANCRENCTVPVAENLRKQFSHLWTYDLYGPVRNAFDAGKSVTRASGRGLGLGNRDFLGPVKWHQAVR